MDCNTPITLFLNYKFSFIYGNSNQLNIFKLNLKPLKQVTTWIRFEEAPGGQAQDFLV